MNIYYKDTVLEILESDKSYRYRAIMADNELTLYFSGPNFIEIPIGAYVEYQGEVYSLTKPENFKKKGKKHFEYTLILNSSQATLRKYKIRNTVDRRLKFSYTAKPHEHLQLIVDNLNQRDSGWTVGDCIDGTEITISYNHMYIVDALPALADICKTEYEISIKRISLRKVEYNKDAPLPLSYGIGKGFKPNVGRTNFSDANPCEILFVQGGERNIDFSKYGSSELLLPKLQELEYEGRVYITDADGFSIRRKDKAIRYNNEDSVDCSEIYPKREGNVSSVVVVDEKNNFYDIVDGSIPEDLNYEDYIIEGSTMTIVFQSGMLTGKEFDVKYIHEAIGTEGDDDYKAGRRFEIVPQELDGQTMPNATFCPRPEDKYAVFNCMLPDAYICNNETKEGASWDMFRKAVRYFYEHEDEQFTFTGELDGTWSKDKWLEIGGKICLGGYVLFTDEHFQTEGAKIRITGIKDFVKNPHSPILELSNQAIAGTVAGELNKIPSTEVDIIETEKSVINYARRGFRDAKETSKMLQDALLNYSGEINPIVVRTMQLVVGDESLQFQFVDDTTTPTIVAHNITFNTDTKKLISPQGIIQHMTLGISSLSSSYKASDYKYWNVAEYTSPVLTVPEKKYYLYVKASMTTQDALMLLSETAIAMDDVAGYYHFLTGILNSEYDGNRSFATMYGYTEILPGQMRVNKIIAPSGNSYFDMLNEAMKLGDRLDFNSRGDGKLRIKGSIIVSESGDEDYIGVFRGVYNSTYVYYQGDEVTYKIGNATSTYRYINETPQKGIVPTTSAYWQIIASAGSDGGDGDDGTDGDFYEYRYAVNGSRTTPPTLPVSSASPSGWSTVMPSVSALQYLWCTVAKKQANGTLITNWGTPIRITPYDGVDGAKGDTGPTMVYRGIYSSSRTYYGNTKRVDAVKYNGHYYVSRVDAGTFSNTLPTNIGKWNDFGAEFESIATNLLLAEGANIGDWWMSGGKIVSALEDGNKITLDASVARILVESTSSGYYDMSGEGTTIDINANSGSIEARATGNYSNVSYISSSGIFSNNAGTNAMPASSGYTHRGAIVGIGFANVNKSDWGLNANETIVAGVYGKASNSGTAPDYGGFFYNLFAGGLTLQKVAVESTTKQLSETDSVVIGYNSDTVSVYLPSSAKEGQMIFVKQWWTGKMRFKTYSGHFIYDDCSSNEYYDFAEGYGGVFIFSIGYINGVKKESWLVSKWRF